MPELPWKKFFPQDWISDPKLSQCSAATRGAWIDAVANMMMLYSDRLTGNDAVLSRFCRVSEAEIQRIHDELRVTGAADVHMQNGCKVWICRRLQRELHLSELRKDAAGKRWNSSCKGDAKTMQNNMQTPMQTAMQTPMHDVDANDHASSASASASVSASTEPVVEEAAPSRVEVVPRDSISDVTELLKRLCSVFGRPENQRPSYMIQRHAVDVVNREHWRIEMKTILEWKPKISNDDLRFKWPDNLESLLSKWDSVLDKARNYKPKQPAESPSSRQTGNY